MRTFRAGEVLENLTFDQVIPPPAPRSNCFSQPVLDHPPGETVWRVQPGMLSLSKVRMRPDDYKPFGNDALVRRQRKLLRSRGQQLPTANSMEAMPPEAVIKLVRAHPSDCRPTPAGQREQSAKSPGDEQPLLLSGGTGSPMTPVPSGRDLEHLITTFPCVEFLDIIQRALKFPEGRKRSRRKRPIPGDVLRLFRDARWRRRTRIGLPSGPLTIDAFLEDPWRWQPGEGVVYQASGDGIPARAAFRFDSRWMKPGLRVLMEPYMDALVMMEAEVVAASSLVLNQRIS